jgi:hypothetical protein
MTSATLRKILMVPALLAAMMTAVSAAPQRTFFCHGSSFPRCLGVLNVAGNDVSYQMTGTPALAEVDEFTDSATTRNVLWSNIDMKGTTQAGEAIAATLDPSRQSSGTVLSVGNEEFPATATMRFFFRIETGGMRLVSDRPAVFQGIIHSIPPAAGDVLTLIGDPVEFSLEGDPKAKLGTLKEASVAFNNPAGTEK